MFEIGTKRMVDIIHICMEENLKFGDSACDCTMGNGHDTLKMCELVGESGRVYSFDIQKEAISNTKKLLDEHHICNAQLVLDSHANASQYIQSQIQFFVFNLGYLPGGDETIITNAESTTKAIETMLSLTSVGHGGAILSYYGHDGGIEEKQEVEKFLQNLPPKYYSVTKIENFNRKNTPPVLYLIKKLRDIK